MMNRVALSSTNSRVGVCCALLFFLALFLPGKKLRAQSPEALLRTHQYTEAISALRGAETGEEALKLGQAHMRRGYFLRDLARLQAQVGARYYARRDTSSSARSTPWSEYYAVRHRMAAGMTEGAMETLRRMIEQRSLPAGYVDRAHVWIGMLQYRNGNRDAAQKTWGSVSESSPAVAADRAQAYWWTGKTLPTLRCGGQEETPAEIRCALWDALQKESWERVAGLQDRLIEMERPTDEVASFEDFSARFYDPGTLRLLAITDFRAAAAAYERAQTQDNAMLLAGIAALEGRDYQEALSAMNQTPNSLSAVYQATLAEVSGNKEKAAQHWRKIKQTNSSQVRAVWAEEAASFESQRASVQDYLEKVAQDVPESREVVLRLGRAALTADVPETAYKLLDAAYPVAESNDLRSIDPAYLSTIAHAKFRLGPQYREEVLRHLNALRQAYPVSSIVDDLTRGFYVPEDVGGEQGTG